MLRRHGHCLTLLWTAAAFGCGANDSFGERGDAGSLSVSTRHEQGLDQSQAALSKAKNIAIRSTQKNQAKQALCLDVKDKDNANGAQLQLYACAGSDNQSFTTTGHLIKVYGDKCLDVKDGIKADGSFANDGAEVQIWTCNNKSANQYWERQGSTLVWHGSGKCLDIKDGNFENGAILQVWTCNDSSPNQAFELGAATTTTKTPDKSTDTATKKPDTSQPAGPAASSSVYGTPIDVSKWQQEVHPAYAFNNEQEAYTDGGKNVSFSGGVTTITAKPTGGNGWSSARLSGDEVGKLPVYLEATIASPTGKGSWPAFWLTARGSWPQGGEIDIMEQINGVNSTNISTHWGAQTGVATFNTHEVIPNVNIAAKHRYGVYLSSSGVQFYLDGKKSGHKVVFPSESNFATIASQMVPILNLAMGGDWPQYAPQSTGTQKMIVYSVSRSSKPPSN